MNARADTLSSPIVPHEQPHAGRDHAVLHPVIPSSQLMHGQRSITISHRGVLYRLQSTRQGKLILTK